MKWKLPELTVLQAQRKVMDMMALRDHTLKEIEKKLKPRCSADTLKNVMTWVQQQSWLPKESSIQEQVVRSLGRKKKGQNYINKKLKEMGLKSVQLPVEIELEKALECVQNKWTPNDFKNISYADKQKEKARFVRFLVGRGFSLSVAQNTFSQFLNKTTHIDDDSDVATGESNDEEF